MNTNLSRGDRFEERLLTAILDDFDQLSALAAQPRRARPSGRRRAAVTLAAGAAAAGIAAASIAAGGAAKPGGHANGTAAGPATGGTANGGPAQVTLYWPAARPTCVPGDSAPGKLAGVGEPPVTVIVKSDAVLVPPLSLITCLITISFGPMSSFVIVQVFVSPSAIVLSQSADFVSV